MSRLQSACVGAGCCTVLAAGLTPLLDKTALSGIAPLLFLVVIVMVSARFGNFAGLLGTISAALIFAIFLFEPRFSLIIDDVPSRNHLIWMIVIGVVISDLLGAYAVRDKDMQGHR